MPLRPATNSAQPAPPAPTPISPVYNSAYGHGFATNRHGEFDHFIRRVNESHLQSTGHWRFATNADDRRAYHRGFITPEDILVTQDQCGGSFDEIILRWVPSTSDPGLRRVLVGSAAQHLKHIHEIRQLLGMPVSLQGHVPIYPTSKNHKIEQYWDQKWTLECAELSEPHNQGIVVNELNDTLRFLNDAAKRPVQPAWTGIQDPSPQNLPSPRHRSSPQCSEFISPTPQARVLEASSRLQPLESVQTSALQQDLIEKPPSDRCLGTSCVKTCVNCETCAPSNTGHALLDRAELDVAADLEFDQRASPTSRAEDGENMQHFLQDDSSVAEQSDSFLEPSQTYFGLPCMDCGAIVGHKLTCYIGNLGPMEPTVLNLHDLAEAVKRFDPGPWTTHFNSVRLTEPEDREGQIIDMADIVRNETSYKNDPILHILPDELMIMLWALKTAPGIQMF